MKRAKLILTAMAIMAVVAGALAFKANRLSTSYCRFFSPGVCTTVFLNTSFSITTTGFTYCTLNPGSLCTQRVVTFVQP